MRSLLSNLSFIKVFLDDIWVYSSNLEIHINHLAILLEIFMKKNIDINYTKCNFCTEQVSFLDYILTPQGIKPDFNCVEGLKDYKTPTTKIQVLKLFGFLNWFRLFLKNLSCMLIPITDKTKKEAKFTWTDKYTETIK